MEDKEIVDLFLNRNEDALVQTEKKYGSFCKFIAKNVLSLQEDAEECVNDALLTVWNKIPPIIPESLKAFLGKLVRDIAITKYRSNHAQKRYSGMDILLSELEECIPSEMNVEENIERQELSRVINEWLKTLSADEKALFIKRYWYGVSVKELALQYGCTQNNMAQKMFVLRNGLKSVLTKEGIEV